ncbi:MAG: C25 family cysteine peptidase [Candidatus Entotheonellia bacterium]
MAAIDVEYGNQDEITVNAIGAATPYPSTIDIAGVAGNITQVTVTIRDIEHPAPSTVEVLLVGPDNSTNVVLMADVGDDTTTDDITITFDDTVASSLPCFDSAPLSSGTFKPTNCTPPGASPFPDPAPDPPYASPALLSVFNGQSPNGTWRLYVNDPVSGGSGRVRLGWIINISTDSPTVARVVAFGGTQYEGGRVQLTWRTSGEVDHLGFRVYRDVGTERELITPGLVAGSALQMGTMTLSADLSYAWVDTLAPETGGVSYWLEDVDLQGQRTWHGPIRPRVENGPPPDRSQATLLSQIGRHRSAKAGAEAGRRGRTPRGRQAVDLARQWTLAAQPAVKIAVREEGWYRVSQEALVTAGLDPASDPHGLRLYLQGREQAIQVHSALPGRFGPGDSIEFYGYGQDTPSSDQHIYWLVAGGGGGARIAVVDSPGEADGASSFLATMERQDRVVYFAGLKNGEAENFFGPPVLTDPLEQVIAVTGLDPTPPGEAILEVALQGVGGVADSNPDHVVQVSVNGVVVGQVVFDGQAWQSERFSIAPTLLEEGENTVTLQAQGGATDVSLLDFVRLSYWRRYTVAEDELLFTVGAEGSGVGRKSRTQAIEGFSTADIRVFDITHPARVQELRGHVAPGYGYTASIQVLGPGGRTLLALTEAQIRMPVSLTANTPSRWHATAQGADLIIVTTTAFADAVQPLQEVRRAEGWQVAVVDIDDLYDEFNYGAASPQALQSFLQLAWERWQPRPRAVLLVGDATYDPRDYLGHGLADYIPTQLVDTEFMETAADDGLVDFNGDGLPELAIGRLPVRTAEAARRMVDKLARYARQEPMATASRALLVADHPDVYDFEQVNARVRAQLPSGMAVVEVQRQHLSDTAAQQLVQEQINAGVAFVTYVGHGTYEFWRGDLLTTTAAHQLSNGERLPVVAAMTCLNGYFHDPVRESLAEALLAAEGGGAVAVWASSGMTYAAGQAAIVEAWTRAIFTGGDDGTALTLGEAAVQAKTATADRDVRRTFLLLGDPSMQLIR